MQSIVTEDMDHCYMCGMSYPEIHHIFFGSKNRDLSTEYGLIIPLCHEHHQGKYGVHKKREVDLGIKMLGQKAFEEHYKDKNFREIFGRNYL